MRILTALFVSTVLFSQAQGLKENVKDIQEVNVLGDRSGFKKIGLYDEEPASSASIKGFTQLSIFDNDLSDEVWWTKNNSCIQVNLNKDGVLNVGWNKDRDGCDWVGMGFGWDAWSSKDIGYIKDTIAIELEVRSAGKPFSNIPWAFCIEDYVGKQAWLGYSKSFLLGSEINSNWTKVQLPLGLFPIEENDVDLTNVKQMMVQMFAAGQIEINSIKIVPFSKKLKAEKMVLQALKSPVIDGNLNDWKSEFTAISDNSEFALNYRQDTLFVAVKVNDDTPFINDKKDGELWNGDAVEIAFSTNASADVKRKFFLLSDQHFGVNCGKQPYVWDWKENRKIDLLECKTKLSDGGYELEMAIPFKSLFNATISSETKLGFEIAIDKSGSNSLREKQIRWNSPDVEGFHLSPSKWGVLIIE